MTTYGGLRGPSPSCTIVPHVLDKLAQHEDPVLAGPARRTLQRDVLERTHRQLTTVIPAPPTVAPRADAETEKPQRTIFDARHGTDLPGKKVQRGGRGARQGRHREPRLRGPGERLSSTS
ncbi:hypothetical protein LV779_28660 [Streptomyces thinghirensis]|nr:hypothetical protein [Streptomyces thinghirensis]